MINKKRPLTLGDIFSTGFSLAGKTFTRNIVIAVIFLVPAGILFAYGFQSFFAGMLETTKVSAASLKVEEVTRRYITQTVEASGKIDSSLNAAVMIDEYDIDLISKGDTAWITLNIPPGTILYRGIVSEIDNDSMPEDSNSDENYISYPVKILILDPDNKTKPGISCEAEIETETRENVICVPYESVTTKRIKKLSEESDSIASFDYKEIVFTVKDGKAKEVEVESGITDYDYIEIISGLEEGEKIVSGSYDEISELSDGSIIKGEDFSRSKVLEIFSKVAIYFLSLIVFSLAVLAVMVGITKIGIGAAEEERISIGDAFKTIFSFTYWRSFGLILVIILSFSAIMFSAVIVMVIAGIVANWIAKLFAGIIIFAAFLFIIYLFFRWYFSFVNIVNTNEGIINSLKKSSFLVKGYWWRTFGIILLISIVVDFAITIISTPISFLFMWDFISQYYSMIANNTLSDNPQMPLEMMESFGFAVGLSIILSSILQSLITPLFNVAMYYDLRIRKNDFPAETIPEAGAPPVE